MKIEIAHGIGNGPTTLAAFDSALNHAGVANFNLIKLSSVIPAGSVIVRRDNEIILGQWGDKLYVVLADMRVDTPNEEAWAGIGWVQDKKTGRGLFAEHTGNSKKTVIEDLTQSLNAFMATRNVDFGNMHMKVVGKTCKHNPVCALVVAVYQNEGWQQ